MIDSSMQRFLCLTTAAIFVFLASAGCGQPPLELNTDQGANHADEPQDLCEAWCLSVGACGLMGYELESCVQFCEASLQPDYVTGCVSCLESSNCEELDSTCLAEGGACHREASVSYLVNISGWGDYPQVQEGSSGYGQLVRWDGVPLGVFAEGDISTDGLGLEFGTVLVPGFSYLLQYFIDVDEDGACDPAVDLAFEAEIHIEEDVVVRYGLENPPDSSEGAICEDFTSKRELCETRCTHLDTCLSLESTREVCISTCEEELSTAFLYRCVECLDRFTCEEQEAACLQIGGVCNEAYIPPSAEYLFSGSRFADYDGFEVTGVLQDLAGQDVTSRMTRTIENGQFFMHFGMSIWPNQDYLFVFFIDDNQTGSCSETNPGWAVEQPIGDVLLHYQLHEHEPEATQDVCARLN